MSVTKEAEDRAKRLPKDSRELYEALRDSGMSPVGALAALRYDGPLPSTDLVEELTESFRESGLSAKGARAAALGRHGTEAELREAGPYGATGMTKSELEKKRKKEKEESEESELPETKKSVGEALGLSREEEKKVTSSDAYLKRFVELMYEDGVSNPHKQALEETVERMRRIEKKLGGRG